jgi:hypothetical protein
MHRRIASLFVAVRECPEALLRAAVKAELRPWRKTVRAKTPRSLLRWYFILFMIVATTIFLRCAGHQNQHIPPVEKEVTAYNDVDIEKKYLAEGFISDETYRVVIVSLKDKDAVPVEAIKNKAKSRAIVSLERILVANHISPDRSTRAEISTMIETNAKLYRKDVEHKRYDVYYFEITKKNLKGYLKNIPSGR